MVSLAIFTMLFTSGCDKAGSAASGGRGLVAGDDNGFRKADAAEHGTETDGSHRLPGRPGNHP